MCRFFRFLLLSAASLAVLGSGPGTARKPVESGSVLELKLRWEEGELLVLRTEIVKGFVPVYGGGRYRFVSEDFRGKVFARGGLTLPRWLYMDSLREDGRFTGGRRPLREPFYLRIPFSPAGGRLKILDAGGSVLLNRTVYPSTRPATTAAKPIGKLAGLRDYLSIFSDRRPTSKKRPKTTAVLHKFRGFLSDSQERGLRMTGIAFADDYQTGEEIASAQIKGKRRNKFALKVPAGEYIISIYARYIDAKTGAEVRYPVRVFDRITIDKSKKRRITLDRGYPFIARVLRRGSRTPVANTQLAVLDPLGGLKRLLISDENGYAGLGMNVENGEIVTLAVAPPEQEELRERLKLQNIKTKRKRAYRIYLDKLSPAAAPSAAIELWKSGPDSGRLNIVILGDGYTNKDEPFTDANGNGLWDGDIFLDANGNGIMDGDEVYFDRDRDGSYDPPEPFEDLNGDGICNRLEQRRFIFDAAFNAATLLNTEPFRSFRDRINVYAVPTVSRQAGTDFPDLEVPIERDNALGSYCEGTGDFLILGIDDVQVNVTARAAVPFVTQAVVVVHDPYGVGRGNTYFNFGRVLLSSSDLRWGLVLLHEFGHSIGVLHDEYVEEGNEDSTYTGSEPEQPNLTINPDPASCKWRDFFAGPIEVPTPYGNSAVGLFEGGGYHAFGIYRPTATSLMRSVYSLWGPVNMHYLQRRLEPFR